MKMNDTKKEFETDIETGAVSHFVIKQNAHTFRILSDSIYSDKPLAVVRELSCNAWDSHIAAKKEDVPFHVHLPNSYEPYFSIKDFGVGLSDSDIMELYCTYGGTNKDKSNDFTGGFGLGSKSPFAYTDQFTVSSIFGGSKSVFNAFIGEDGSPQVMKTSETPSTEPNGLEVKVPVEPRDFNSFRSKAQDIYPRFPVLPLLDGVTNFQLDQVKYLLEGDNFRVIEKHGYGRARASREQLNYDDKTEATIIAKVDLAIAELQKKFQESLKGVTSYYSACLVFHSFDIGTSSLNNVIREGATFEGRELSGSFKVKEVEGINFKSYSYYDLKKVRPNGTNTATPYIYPKEDATFYYNDREKKFSISKLVKHHYDSHKNSGGVIIIEGDIALLPDAKKALGDPPTVTLMSTLEMYPIEKKASTAGNGLGRSKRGYRNLIQYGGEFDLLEGEVVNHDCTEGGYYLKTYCGSLFQPHPLYYKYNGNLKTFIEKAKELGFLEDKPVFILDSKTNKVPDTYSDAGWKEVTTEIHDVLVRKFKASQKFRREIATIKDFEESRREVDNFEVPQGVALDEKASSAYTVFSKVYPKYANESPLRQVLNGYNELDFDVTKEKPLVDIKKLTKDLESKYPLVKATQWYRMENRSVAFNDYIKMCDKYNS